MTLKSFLLIIVLLSLMSCQHKNLKPNDSNYCANYIPIKLSDTEIEKLFAASAKLKKHKDYTKTQIYRTTKYLLTNEIIYYYSCVSKEDVPTEVVNFLTNF